MKIKDRPEYKTKPKPMTCKPDETIRDAATRMGKANYGAIIVTDGEDKVTGMLTERDILRRVVAEGVDPDTTRVAEVMTADPRCANADEDYVDWLRIMSNERFRRLPIVDGDGKLVNIMTQGDFVSYTWPDLMGRVKDMATGTISSNYNVALIIGGVALYTIILLGIIT